MELAKLIQGIVSEVGFGTDKKEEVVLDLFNMINFKFLIILAEDKQYENDIYKIRQLEEQKDFVGIRSKLSELSKKPNLGEKFKKAFVEIVRDWIISVAPSLPENKKQEIILKLKTGLEK